MKHHITHKKLQETLHYDKTTGIFIWKVTKNSRALEGEIAGSLNDRGYHRIRIDKKSYYSHRLAWLYEHGNLPVNQIDHINHIKSDNRIINLREATSTENQKNRSKSTRNKSGVVGVYWSKNHSKWTSAIGVNRKLIHLGMFTNFKEAVLSRKEAEKHFKFHENHGK